ncbi:glycosyltransferase family 4 protein [Pontivivens nitratireducens]|uniref:glycosyltransferase family 4 protein n=1 Tax=Pontivivens nitratireducens TaxID=2758038 RepID=UPI00163A1D58|nr:glycosyltransferase family 4 protein [Pontibrevibacter nitratireducens]
MNDLGPDTARPLTVLQLVPTLESGGVERGAIEIVKALSAAGHRALVVSAGGRMEPQLRRAGGEFIKMDIGSKNPLTIWQNARALQHIIEEQGVDIVHARSRAPAWAGWRAAKATGTRFVTTYHGVYNEGDLPFKRWYNSVMARGNPVIAVSGHVAQVVQQRHGIDASRIVTIPRGADIHSFAEEAVTSERTVSLAQAWGVIDDARPIVMLPGRLTRWKGAEDLIAAAALLKKRDAGFDMQIVLVGDDAGSGYRGTLEHAVRNADLAGSVRMVGHCADMEAAYKLAAVVVSASREPEAFGRVAVEAQAMGRPVIATAHGGSLETVEDGVTGWLYPPGDVEALADAVQAALSLDDSARAHMGLAARARIRSRFTVEMMQQATLAVYEGG